MRRVPLAALLVVLAVPSASAMAQQSHRPQFALAIGRNVTSWSGPYLGESGRSTYGVASLTVPVRPLWAIRGEINSQGALTDLTYHSEFVDRARLNSQLFGTGLLARRYFTPDTARGTWYVDAGLNFRQHACDVDESGGLADVGGFFGTGITTSCEDHEDESGRRRLTPVGRSVAPIIAIGAQSKRFGVQLRLEPLAATVARTDAGALRVRTASVMVEWHTRRR